MVGSRIGRELGRYLWKEVKQSLLYVFFIFLLIYFKIICLVVSKRMKNEDSTLIKFQYR